jgi:CRP/FNR family transcriptional regulator
MRALASRCAWQQQERFAGAATLPVEARLATWLLAQAAASPRAQVELPGTQQELAELLG